MSVDNTLSTRQKTHGSYVEQTRVTRKIKDAMHVSMNWQALPSDMKEALDMIAVKMGRILTGDPSHADSWHDIAGYARLVEKRLEPPSS